MKVLTHSIFLQVPFKVSQPLTMWKWKFCSSRKHLLSWFALWVHNAHRQSLYTTSFVQMDHTQLSRTLLAVQNVLLVSKCPQPCSGTS